ncbi:MAG: hypothetical protein AUJ98_04430 [Bacteroidetes bacterium CG2_30_33_31]|nr:MAG: hypothetical protein AUJ98_04430 [Bacteroidetes bacterium CG2_30_33_31]
MNENENISKLLQCIRKQEYKNFKVWICVNQPESFWQNPDKVFICKNNSDTLKTLASIEDFSIEIIDKTSKSNGWQGKNSGVGIARKTIMDKIIAEALDEEIIISLDGDTSFSKKYFQSIAENFYMNADTLAISIPYFHNLTGDEMVDRAILHYEIYMRYYSLNMNRIGSPYNFTALGSAISCRISVYRQIGGLTPKNSGEDFYFLQKIVKYKPLSLWNSEKVFPAARFSDRVFFGTGPAMIKGANGDWKSYPIYRHEIFNEIENFFNQLPDLYKSDFQNIADELFGTQWAKNIRNNTSTLEAFIRSCHQKFDGLRTLQYLKMKQERSSTSDEENFSNFISKFYSNKFPEELIVNLNFANSPIDKLENIRKILVEIEDLILMNYSINLS